jgi:hypothetical protein
MPVAFRDPDRLTGHGRRALRRDALAIAAAGLAAADPVAAFARSVTLEGDVLWAGDLLVTGPTGTNVNDLRVLLTGR